MTWPAWIAFAAAMSGFSPKPDACVAARVVASCGEGHKQTARQFAATTRSMHFLRR